MILKVITKPMKSATYADDINTSAIAIADNDVNAAANNNATNDDNNVASDRLCCRRFLMPMLLTPGNDAR